jgi:hypothetical protein
MPKMAPSKTQTPQDIIRQSGHSFHARVVKLLRDLGWSVIVSPYYSDNFTDKPREIDIIAERPFRYEHPAFGLYGDVVVQLFIECKYVLAPTVFWFDAKDVERAVARIRTDTGWPDPRRGKGLNQHHYLSSNPVAKLFSSGSGRSDENEAFSRAINQNLNALVYYRHRGGLVLSHSSSGKTLGHLAFPIIAVNAFDNMYSTDMADSSIVNPVVEPFQLEVNYAYTDKDRNGHNEYFLIDVVSLAHLTDFLAALDTNDVGAMMEFINWNARPSR